MDKFIIIDKEYFVAYTCGPTGKKDRKCTSSIIKDFSDATARMEPCNGETPLAGCPTTGDNVTVTTCYCEGDLCNLTNNLQPNGIWITMIGVIATLLTFGIN